MGICGSDKNFYRGYLPPKTAEFRQDPKFPFLLGHESGGTVVAVGSRVADYKVGDKVMAFGWNNNFAEYFAAKSFQLQPVPYGLDMDIAHLLRHVFRPEQRGAARGHRGGHGRRLRRADHRPVRQT